MNVDLPSSVRSYLDARTFAAGRMACRETRCGVVTWSGIPELMGVVRDGSWLDDVLMGLTDDQDLVLPLIQSPSGVALQVHLFRRDESQFVLLVSLADVVQDLRERQQMSHEQILAHQERSQSLQQMARARQAWSGPGSEDAQAVVTAFAHEFGTPLTALLGQLELLRNSSAQHGFGEQLAAMRRSASHLHALVQGLLDEARLGQGTLELSVVECRCDELCADLSAMFEPEARRLSVAWKASSDGSVFRVDQVRVRQVLINLLSNALKYGRRSVSLTLRHEHGELRADVRDQGSGFSKRQRERLFTPFNRLGKEDGEGTGLGLFIARQLVLALGGALELVSGEGEGAAFQLRIPVAAAEAPMAHERSVALLVVDDDPDVRAMLHALLSNYRFQVREAAGLKEALREIELVPEALLVDLGLGDESGLDVIARARAQGFRGRIVATSADFSSVQSRLARQAGADAFVAKPFDTSTLLNVLRRQ